MLGSFAYPGRRKVSSVPAPLSPFPGPAPPLIRAPLLQDREKIRTRDAIENGRFRGLVPPLPRHCLAPSRLPLVPRSCSPGRAISRNNPQKAAIIKAGLH